MAKKKDENYVPVGGLLLPATPDLKSVEAANKDFMQKAAMDPIALDKAMRIAAGEIPPDADLVKKTEKLLEILPEPPPEDVQPTIGREQLVFLDEMFAPVPEVKAPIETGKVNLDFAKVKSDGGSTSYYELPKGATELNDLIEHKGMSFALGNIFKACYRLGEKDGTDVMYDLNKMELFITRLKNYVKKHGRLP